MGKRYADIENTILEGVEREENWYGGSLRFNWNYSNEELINRLGIRKELNKAMASIVMSYCAEFTPFKSGDLAKYVQTFGAKDHGTITYQKPYASRQYYLKSPGSYEYPNNESRTLNPHDKASSFWDKQAWSMYRDEIVEDVDKERIKLCRR